jgi:uncharacterized protein (TIGR03435 family)
MPSITRVIAVSIVLAASLSAQTFNSASVKRSAAYANGSTFEFTAGGSLRVLNGIWRGLIESAYDVTDFQIAGGPSWLNTDRYDLLARSGSGEATASGDEMKATRFQAYRHAG